jgi:hypothetical protein
MGVPAKAVGGTQGVRDSGSGVENWGLTVAVGASTGVGDTGVGGTVVGSAVTGVSAIAVGIDCTGVLDTAVEGGFTATSVGVEMADGVAVDDGGVGIESQADRNRLNRSRLHKRCLRGVSA